MNAFVLGSTVVGTLGVMAWRVREGQTPVTLPKIIAPPLGMSTGFCMFFAPRMRIPLEWAGVAFALGVFLFAWPMIFTTRLHKDPDGHVWMRRSPAFFIMLISLAVIRFGLRDYFEQFISYWQTGALAFVLAFGGVLHWRLNMLYKFNKLKSGSADSPAHP